MAAFPESLLHIVPLLPLQPVFANAFLLFAALSLCALFAARGRFAGEDTVGARMASDVRAAVPWSATALDRKTTAPIRV